MDDQNLTNQPPVPGAAPVVPSVPEDITPVEAPVTTTTTTTTTSEPTTPIDSIPLSQIEQTPIPVTPVTDAPVAPEEPSPVAAWPIPEANPETIVTTTTTTTTPEPFAISTPTPTELATPENKPKNKLLPVIGAIAAFLLVVGVAGAAYYVSNQLTTKQAVAPNAPTSKPAASWSCIPVCPGSDCDGGTRCNGGINYVCHMWNEGNCGQHCDGGYWQASGTCGVEPTTGPTNSPNENCPGECVTDYGGNCHEDQCGYGPGYSCANQGACCRPLGECVNNNPTEPPPAPVSGAWSAWSACSATACGTTGTKTRTCSNPAPANGGAECTKTNGTATTPADRTESASCSAAACPVNGAWSAWSACSATACGTTGTKTRTCSNPAPASGGAECTKTDGTATTPAARSESASCSAVECPGACTLINVYRKVGTTYSTTALTSAQLQSLIVGDVLKLSMTDNIIGLAGRFRVTINGTAGAWISGVVDTTNKKLITLSDYKVATAGAYKFEGQVTTTAQ